jgi:integrase
VEKPEAQGTVAQHAQEYCGAGIRAATGCGSRYGANPALLNPIWNTKTETASRLRGRIESVLSWATVHGYREGENPARWRGHLDQLLAAPSRVNGVVHHPALPYAEIGAFMVELQGHKGIASRALEFTILTATRTAEIIAAEWPEIDLPAKTWTIPAVRMKAGREHRVPLSPAAITALRAVEGHHKKYVFPGHKRGTHLSAWGMLAVLRRMDRTDITVHGFRSTFRDWCAETTAFSEAVAEMALAHTLKNETEAAYRRGDLFEKRRKLMNEWVRYCDKVPDTATVTPIRRVRLTKTGFFFSLCGGKDGRAAAGAPFYQPISRCCILLS